MFSAMLSTCIQCLLHRHAIIIVLQAVLVPITDISPFLASPETAVALLGESYTFVLESAFVPHRMSFKFVANFY